MEHTKIDFFNLAIKNISMHGDTDIFPYPIENALFYDMPDKVRDLIRDIDTNFDAWLSQYPVESIKTCIPVAYTGFRLASLIDPLWNAYLLSEVLKISQEIEEKRIPISKKSVFSYRINLDWDSGKIFNNDIHWRLFYNTAIEYAENFSHVVRFDISDFYNRVYHHRLQNALERVVKDNATVSKIMKILNGLSNNVSYGLPIGGNASRILAETLLNSMDQMMLNRKIKFCRFVDDYIVFANSEEDAYKNLTWCADFLLRNEGLSLQKSKTIIQSNKDFISHAKATLEGEEGDTNKERGSFMKLHIHFDPYSATANEDYSELKEKLEQFDIVSLIKSEVRKSKIHQAFGKQLLNAVSILSNPGLSLAFNSICSNLEVLYPIFPSVMQLAYRNLLKCDEPTINLFISTLCDLVEKDSYIIQSDNNASYVARVLSLVNSEVTVQAIVKLNTTSNSHLVRTNCLYAMANMNNTYWLSYLKPNFATLSKWERRAFIASSFILGDEGKHWKQNTKTQFSKFELLIEEWARSKNPERNKWKLPL